MIQYCTRIYFLFFMFVVIIPHNYSQNFPDKESVLLWNFNKLIEPKNDSITIKSGEKIIVACPGPENNLVKTGTQYTSAKCVSGQTLKVKNVNLLLSNLSCNTLVTGECKGANKACGEFKGFIKHIGHRVNYHFTTLFDVCYSNIKGESLFADHVIYGSAIANAKSLNTQPSFTVGCLASGKNASTAYNTKTQLKTFKDLLGSEDLAKKYINSNSNLARGQLVPDADQVYVTSKLSTYLYINTVPQWQQINNGNWKSLEDSIRKVATTSKGNLRVITGGWDVLKLKHKNGILVKIYLSGQKLPVPKFVWKIAYSLKTKKGIAFVSVNNPFSVDKKKICTDICNSSGWGSKDWSNATKGLLYCCKIDDFRKKVKSVPKLNVIDILKGT